MKISEKCNFLKINFIFFNYHLIFQIHKKIIIKNYSLINY